MPTTEYGYCAPGCISSRAHCTTRLEPVLVQERKVNKATRHALLKADMNLDLQKGPVYVTLRRANLSRAHQ